MMAAAHAGDARTELGSLLRLTLPAPDSVAAMLDGRQRDGPTLQGLMETFPIEWVRPERCQGVFKFAVPVEQSGNAAGRSSND